MAGSVSIQAARISLARPGHSTGSGSGNRTRDLQGMGLSRYLCAIPQKTGGLARNRTEVSAPQAEANRSVTAHRTADRILSSPNFLIAPLLIRHTLTCFAEITSVGIV